MANTYEGDHIDISGKFYGPVTGKVENHHHGPVPKATASLPPAPAVFTGRDADLSRLLPNLDPSAHSELAVLICSVSGLGGIGKTSLALQAAHRAAEDGWFPGGTLFVDLRGYDQTPFTADQAVLALLDALGVRGTDLPTTAGAQHALYRSLLAQEHQPAAPGPGQRLPPRPDHPAPARHPSPPRPRHFPRPAHRPQRPPHPNFSTR